MDRRKLEIARFEEAIAVVREHFPHLKIDIERQPVETDALATIPAQPGLDFEISINLQNLDELHLIASHFRVEWFPCGDQEEFERFVDAAMGLISGRYRIVESLVLGVAVQAQLERPAEQGWRRVTAWANLGVLIPWPRSKRVVQNRSGSPARPSESR